MKRPPTYVSRRADGRYTFRIAVPNDPARDSWSSLEVIEEPEAGEWANAIEAI